jgi:integrase/recombinase XerD
MSQSSSLSFERHLKAQGKRPGTVDSYRMIVERFLRWTGVAESAVTADHAYAYLVERGNEMGLSAAWFNVQFHAVVSWLTMHGLATDLRGLRPKRVPRQPPRWFTRTQVQQLLGAVEQRHYRLFFQVMVATGLRVSEVIALEVADLDAERPLLRVRCGKGGDGRLVPIPPTLQERLRAYWRSFRPRGVLFQRVSGVDDRALLASTINAALRRAACAAGLTERVSSHRLRHSFAVHSLRGGMDLVTLQQVMGHRCIESTVRYLTPDLRRGVVSVDLLRDLGVDP